MQLNIQIDTHKSNLFLDLLDVLKKDNMISDFKVISNQTDESITPKLEILDKNDPDFHYIVQARQRRDEGEKTYSIDEVLQEYK